MNNPKLNVFTARSFWIAFFTVLMHAGVLIGAEFSPEFEPTEAADKAMNFVTALAAAWVFFERQVGEMKLTLPWRI